MNIPNLKKDINIFKDETLKTMRYIEKQLLEKMKMKDIETESKIADFDLKLSKFQEINKRMYESVIEQHTYLEKIQHLNDFQSKTETRLISFDVKLSSFLCDLANIKNRYDKLFLENLTIPGIIGNACKFRSISDYINDSIKTADQLKLEKELIKKQIKELKTRDEQYEKNLRISIDNSISTCKLYTDKKIEEIKNYIFQKFEEFEEILSNTKSKIEENVLKSEQISSTMKNEMKTTKEEITFLIEEKNKENEKMKYEIKKNQTLEFKKEINEMKKNFTELKINMEKQIVNAYNLGKNKLKINSNTNNSNSSVSNNNIFLKRNNLVDETKTKTRNYFDEPDHVIFSSNEKNNIYTKNKEIFTNFKRKESRKNINMISQLLKNKNDNNNIETATNDYNNINNKNEEQEKYRIKLSGKNIQIKSLETSNNIKIYKKEENKDDNLLMNQFNIINNNKEHKILMPKNLKKNRIEPNFNPNNNENTKNNNELISRNKSFSKISNNKLVLEQHIVSDGNNHNNLDTKNNINNKRLFNEKINNNLYDNKKKPKTTKFVIHSIDGENNISNSKRKNTDLDNKSNRNMAIKLMKNKMKNINDSNLAYIQQQSPTMGLYKEYYDKKMKELQKEKLNDMEPKKVSPVFGRTAYIKFENQNNNINLKQYNGKMNIVINDNINEYIKKNKYFYTIGVSTNKMKSAISRKNNNKKRKNNKEGVNVSV